LDTNTVILGACKTLRNIHTLLSTSLVTKGLIFYPKTSHTYFRDIKKDFRDVIGIFWWYLGHVFHFRKWKLMIGQSDNFLYPLFYIILNINLLYKLQFNLNWVSNWVSRGLTILFNNNIKTRKSSLWLVLLFFSFFWSSLLRNITSFGIHNFYTHFNMYPM